MSTHPTKQNFRRLIPVSHIFEGLQILHTLSIDQLDDIEFLYGKTRYEFVELKEKDEKGDPYYEMVRSNEFAADEKHQKEIDEVRYQMLLKSQDRQKRAHKLLWDFIEHNIQNWWD